MATDTQTWIRITYRVTEDASDVADVKEDAILRAIHDKVLGRWHVQCLSLQDYVCFTNKFEDRDSFTAYPITKIEVIELEGGRAVECVSGDCLCQHVNGRTEYVILDDRLKVGDVLYGFNGFLKRVTAIHELPDTAKGE